MILTFDRWFACCVVLFVVVCTKQPALTLVQFSAFCIFVAHLVALCKASISH